MLLASLGFACFLSTQSNRLSATPVQLGDGTASTWIQFAPNSKSIESVGITFSESCLTNLPDAKDLSGKYPKKMWMLDLPKPIFGKPFDHVEIDWNPIGHPPLAYYNKPHFDFHFFTIPMETLMSITAKGDDIARCMKKPPDAFIPQGYVLLDHVTPLPQMGVHWTNPATSPEIQGAEFTSTFVYGTYDGKTAFWEPMITLKYLLTKPEFHQEVPQPQAYDETGYYPTSYSLSYNADKHEYTVELDGLVYHKAEHVN
jgi:hypothetical protein